MMRESQSTDVGVFVLSLLKLTAKRVAVWLKSSGVERRRRRGRCFENPSNMYADPWALRVYSILVS